MIELAACLCFKDSAPYLQEWLTFHYVQGFRRFYLYDNESSDDYLPVIQRWRDLGLAELIVFPGKGKQTEMYNDCLARARGQVKWLSFIDDDEFLYPTGDESLLEVLKDFEDAAGLAISWWLFGSGGHEQPSSDWVIRRFTQSAGGPDQHFKCIVRPDRISHSEVVGHLFTPTSGFQVLTENREPQPGPRSQTPSAKRIRVNHYLIKSWVEWKARRSRAEVNTGIPTPHPEPLWREWDTHWSRVTDTSAQRFLSRMEEAARSLGFSPEDKRNQA